MAAVYYTPGTALVFTGQGKALKCLNTAPHLGLLLCNCRVPQSCFPEIETVGIAGVLACLSPSQTQTVITNPLLSELNPGAL